MVQWLTTMRTLGQLFTDFLDFFLIVTSWLLLLHMPHPHGTTGRKRKEVKGEEMGGEEEDREGFSLQRIL